MKVVLVSAAPPPEGGVATWTKEFMAYCKLQGVDIYLVNTALIGARGKQFNTKTTLHDEIKRTSHILKTMRRALKDKAADIVHINSSCSNTGILRDYMCVKIANKRQVPIVFHCHCNVRDQITAGFAQKILKNICGRVSKIFVLNSDSFNFVNDLTGIKPIVVPNFIRSDLLNENRKTKEELKEIVFIGHVQVDKGSKEIIRAAKKLPDKHFTLVGPVEADIAELEISENVTLTGAKSFEEAQDRLKKADVFLFPSYTEGFSLSLTEAMASGLPCIATDVGSNKDMLEDQGGIIIQTKNVDAIVEAINELDDIKTRESMSLWNINKVKNNYIVDKVIETVIDIYNKMFSVH